MLVGFLVFGALASAYGTWQPDNESIVLQDLDDLLEQLAAMVERAKNARAAHPEFIIDLENMVTLLKAQRDIIAESLSADARQNAEYYSQPKEISGPEVRYLGFVDDKVGPWDAAEPDGQNDHCFQVLVYFPSKVEVQKITLHSSNSEGVKGPSYWFSHQSDAWILGVFQDGNMLNRNRESSLGRFAGWVLFDIYVSDDGQACQKDRYLLLELTTDDQVLTKLFQVGEPEHRFDQL